MAAVLSAGGAHAQKQWRQPQRSGSSSTCPGFDPLKVGVFDTSANMAAVLLFDTLTALDDDGEAQPRLGAVVDALRRLQDLDLQASART